jgi:hypothetical protein
LLPTPGNLFKKYLCYALGIKQKATSACIASPLHMEWLSLESIGNKKGLNDVALEAWPSGIVSAFGEEIGAPVYICTLAMS